MTIKILVTPIKLNKEKKPATTETLFDIADAAKLDQHQIEKFYQAVSGVL